MAWPSTEKEWMELKKMILEFRKEMREGFELLKRKDQGFDPGGKFSSFTPRFDYRRVPVHHDLDEDDDSGDEDSDDTDDEEDEEDASSDEEEDDSGDEDSDDIDDEEEASSDEEDLDEDAGNEEDEEGDGYEEDAEDSGSEGEVEASSEEEEEDDIAGVDVDVSLSDYDEEETSCGEEEEENNVGGDVDIDLADEGEIFDLTGLFGNDHIKNGETCSLGMFINKVDDGEGGEAAAAFSCVVKQDLSRALSQQSWMEEISVSTNELNLQGQSRDLEQSCVLQGDSLPGSWRHQCDGDETDWKKVPDVAKQVVIDKGMNLGSLLSYNDVSCVVKSVLHKLPLPYISPGISSVIFMLSMEWQIAQSEMEAGAPIQFGDDHFIIDQFMEEQIIEALMEAEDVENQVRSVNEQLKNFTVSYYQNKVSDDVTAELGILLKKMVTLVAYLYDHVPKKYGELWQCVVEIVFAGKIIERVMFDMKVCTWGSIYGCLWGAQGVFDELLKKDAKTVQSLNGQLEIVGIMIRVLAVTDQVGMHEVCVNEAEFDDNDGGSLSLNAQIRAMLMQKLARTCIVISIIGSFGNPAINRASMLLSIMSTIGSVAGAPFVPEFGQALAPGALPVSAVGRCTRFTNKCCQIVNMVNTETDLQNTQVQGYRDQAYLAIGQFFYSSGLQPLSDHDIRGYILKSAADFLCFEMEQYTALWGRTDCTIICEEWTILSGIMLTHAYSILFGFSCLLECVSSINYLGWLSLKFIISIDLLYGPKSAEFGNFISLMKKELPAISFGGELFDTIAYHESMREEEARSYSFQYSQTEWALSMKRLMNILVDEFVCGKHFNEEEVLDEFVSDYEFEEYIMKNNFVEDEIVVEYDGYWKGFVVEGLVTLDITCYFKSVMQTLLVIGDLGNYFSNLDWWYIDPFNSSLRDLFYEILGRCNSQLSLFPMDHFNCNCCCCPQIVGHGQHDNIGLLVCLLGKWLLPKVKLLNYNVITPGTKFREEINQALHIDVCRTFSKNEWCYIKVFLADSHIAGEGEHKIGIYDVDTSSVFDEKDLAQGFDHLVVEINDRQVKEELYNVVNGVLIVLAKNKLTGHKHEIITVNNTGTLGMDFEKMLFKLVFAEKKKTEYKAFLDKDIGVNVNEVQSSFQSLQLSSMVIFKMIVSMEALNRDRKIILVVLYFLIWGEVANVCLFPECLCYIFHNIPKELVAILNHSEAEPAKSCIGESDSVPFLEKIITPIYGTMTAEANNNNWSGLQGFLFFHVVGVDIGSGLGFKSSLCIWLFVCISLSAYSQLLLMRGGIEELTGRLSASIEGVLSTKDASLGAIQEVYRISKVAENEFSSFFVFVWEAVQDMKLMILALCAFVSLIVGIQIDCKFVMVGALWLPNWFEKS